MKKLLVVDDNKSIRDLLSLAFTGSLQDCSVQTAENGATAAQILDSSSVDAILTDLSMPVMDGYQLIEYVTHRSSGIPIMAMTGEPIGEVDDRLKALGVKKCFEKPFDLQDVVEEIASALGLAKNAPIRMAAPEHVIGSVLAA